MEIVTKGVEKSNQVSESVTRKDLRKVFIVAEIESLEINLIIAMTLWALCEIVMHDAITTLPNDSKNVK